MSAATCHARMRALAHEGAGQMCVELAVLLPVTIVIALAGINLARYVELCARFDRVALDAVVGFGVAPAGSQDAASAAAAVEGHIAQALGDVSGLEVSVSPQAVGRLGQGGATFSLAPSLTRYVCEMRLAPWPSSLVIAGVRLGAPVWLTHERSLVVDRFRPGVVV